MIKIKNYPDKLIVGTAQLVDGYGRFRITKNLKFKDVKNIFKFLKKSKIKFIETSTSYIEAIKKLKNLNLSNFKIILKFSGLNLNNYKEKIEDCLKISKYNFNKKNIFCLMFHSEKDIKNKNFKKYINYLLKLKRKNKIKYIGVSIYNFDLFSSVINKYPIDIVQVPFNILDKRILDNKIINIIKKKKIKIHARSIFLQGLLLQNQFGKDNLIKSNKNFFKKWDKLNYNSVLKKIENCIKFVLNFNHIDKILLGIDNIYQLKQTLFVLKKTRTKNKLDFQFKSNNNLLDPRKW